MQQPTVYLAGPDVFVRDPQARSRDLKATLSSHGLVGKFPLDTELDLTGLPPAEFAQRISDANERLIRSCDAVLANLTPFRGPSADVGTVYEVGFAVALGKMVMGYSESDSPFMERTSA